MKGENVSMKGVEKQQMTIKKSGYSKKKRVLSYINKLMKQPQSSNLLKSWKLTEENRNRYGIHDHSTSQGLQVIKPG